jgi:hypothetical protein
MALATDDQLTLPTLERKGKVSAAQIATRKRTIYARSLNQDAYMRARWSARTGVRHRPAGTGKPIAAAMPRCCWSAAWWSASSCRGRPSRPANGSASCRAT